MLSLAMDHTNTLASPYTIQICRNANQISYKPAFWFNQLAFISGQPCREPVFFQVWNTKIQQAEGLFILFEKEGAGVSPCRAPFGSVEYKAHLPLTALDLLVRAVDAYALQHNLPEVRITSYPFCYDPAASALLTTLFTQHGYAIVTTDLNFHIPVVAQSLEARMHLSEKRRLRKCLRAGFRFSEEQEPDLPAIHQFISRCRARRGFPLTLDYTGFQRLFTDFPAIYRIFTVKDGTQLVAVTVAIRVSPSILYYFLPADHEQYTSFSPTVLLLSGLYGYAQANDYNVLDLGIATDRGQPNYGLIRFKQHMGGEPSLKLTFRKAFGTT